MTTICYQFFCPILSYSRHSNLCVRQYVHPPVCPSISAVCVNSVTALVPEKMLSVFLYVFHTFIYSVSYTMTCFVSESRFFTTCSSFKGTLCKLAEDFLFKLGVCTFSGLALSEWRCRWSSCDTWYRAPVNTRVTLTVLLPPFYACRVTMNTSRCWLNYLRFENYSTRFHGPWTDMSTKELRPYTADCCLLYSQLTVIRSSGFPRSRTLGHVAS